MRLVRTNTRRPTDFNRFRTEALVRSAYHADVLAIPGFSRVFHKGLEITVHIFETGTNTVAFW